jgi:hypothetical protein
MATVTSIAQAIIDRVKNNLTDVDQASIGTFLPPVSTVKTALVLTPLEQRDVINWQSFGNTMLEASQRLRLEFWVKRVNAADAATMTRAREIGIDAAKTLAQGDGTGYELDGDEPFVVDVEPALVEVGNAVYVVVRMYVTVRNEIAL